MLTSTDQLESASGLRFLLDSFRAKKNFDQHNLDELVTRLNSSKFVILAKAGIQVIQTVLNRDASPEHDPGLATVTTQETFYDSINLGPIFRVYGNKSPLIRLKIPTIWKN